MRSKFMENSGQLSTSDPSQNWQGRTAEGHQHESERRCGTNPVHILHLEDSKEDRALIEFMLKDAGIDCQISAVETRSGYVQNLGREDWDLILCDFSVPSLNGLEALEIAVRTCPSTPFIFVTGTTGEEVVVESLRSGATDYVLKQKIARLVPSVRRALNERAERLQRQWAEAELDKSEKRVRFLAFHDPLTDLPNRAFFQDRLPQILADAARRGERVALLNIDLDNFKNINDSLGHPAGDLLLQQVAERLKRHTREGDLVARLGGDEFVVVVGAESDSTDAGIAAERIKNGLAAEFKLHDKIVSISCSIGISVFPEDGRDVEALFKNADAALFSAKEEGRNRWQFFVPEMNRRAIERLSIESALRVGLKNEQFFLEYQPQIELSTGRIIGAEALLRWQYSEDELIPPDQFIFVAESTGEIIPIGEWVLKKACTQAKQWQDEGIPPITMTVNISAVQVREGSLLTTVKEILDETGLAPEFLELETTESLLLARDEKVASQMRGLRDLGLRMAIDDFGTGYSSFSYVRRFRFDRLKIDGSFVQNLTMDPDDTEIVSGIISFGATLKMEVIAECVETREQVEILRSLGCDQIQGYYVSRPLGAAALAEMLRSQSVPMPALPRPVPNALQLSRKRLEMAISLSEALMESLPAAVCIFNASGQVRRWNTNFLGYSADEMFQAGLMRAVAPESQDAVQQMWGDAFERGIAETEAWLLSKGGTKIPCYLKGVRIEFENEPCMLGIAIDLSKQKQAEEESRRCEEATAEAATRLRTIFASVQTGILLIDPKTHRIVDANPAALQVIQSSRERVLGAECHQFICPTQRGMCPVTDLGQILDNAERVLLTASGEKRHIFITVVTVQIAGRDHLLESFVDITERKRAEELLQNSESNYRALFESAADAYLLMGEKGFLDCNAAALQMFGYSTKAEFVAMHPAEYSPPSQPDGTDSRAGSEQKMAAAFRDGSTRFDWVHKRKNGELFPAEVCMSAIKLNSGPALLGTIRDFTDRKRAAAALQRSEAELKEALRAANMGIWTWTQATGVITWDENFYRIAGRDSKLPPPDFQELKQFYTPESWARLMVAVESALATETPFEIDLQVVRPDGSTRWTAAHCRMLRDDAGHSIGLRGSAQDITERKRTEESLKLFRTLIDQAGDAIEVIDPETLRYLDVNERTCRNLGYTRNELLCMRVPDIDLHIEARKGLVEEEFRTKQIAHFETEHRRKDGSIFPVEVSIQLVHLDSAYAVSTARDITERKRAEESLRRLEHQYRTIFAGLNDAVFITEFTDDFSPGRVLEVNDMACTRLGYTREELLRMSPADLDAPEDMEKVLPVLRQLETQKHVVFETIHVAKDGRRIPVEMNVGLIEFDGRRAYLGIARDITERKRTEESLRLFRTLIDQASDAIEVTDPETLRYLDVNETACLSLGYTRDEMLSMRVPDVNLHTEDMRDRVNQALREKGSAQFEAEHRRKDGSIFPVEVKLQMVQSDRAYVVSTARDITERKRAEEAIESLARTDALTGLANRRVLEETLPRETARAKRLQESLSVIFADLDQFKSINDRFGHRAGDQVLVRVGVIIKSQLRSYALASRFGGDEFVLLLPGTTKDGAVTVAERIREKVAASAVPECPRPITVSLGVVTFEADESGEELLARADRALYQAKEKGGNRVERA